MSPRHANQRVERFRGQEFLAGRAANRSPQTDLEALLGLAPPGVDLDALVVRADPDCFDRDAARGFRLDIAAGTAVRFEPGQTRTVQLVALAGDRKVYGFRGLVQGAL